MTSRIPWDGYRWKIAVLNAGQGDAVFIQAPQGADVPIDGGLSSGAL